MNTSDTKSSAFITRFRAKLDKDKKYFAPLMLMQMLGMPLMALVSAWYGSSIMNTYNTAPEELRMQTETPDAVFMAVSVISGTAAAAAILTCILLALSNFRYLYRKTESDMNMALPVNRTQMFMADFFSGLITCLIPLVIAAALTSAIVWFSPDHCFRIPSMLSEMLGLEDDPVLTDLGYTLSHEAASGILYRLIPSVTMIYTFTVLVSVMCGTLFETVIYLAGSNIAATAFLVSLEDLIMTSVPNFSYRSFDNITYEAERIVPAGTLLHVLPGHEYGEANWFVSVILFTVLYFIPAWKLFLARKAERTSEPFAYSAFFYIVSALITGTVSNAMMLSFFLDCFLTPTAFLAVIFTAAVIFAVMLLIRFRGIHIKHPARQLVFFISSAALSAVVFYSVTETDSFGLTYYIPDAGKIACAEIHLPEIHKSDYGSAEETDSYTSPDAVREIIRLNEELNTDLKNCLGKNYNRNPEYCQPSLNRNFYNSKYSIYGDTETDIRIVYHLKNGKITDRLYTPVNTDYTACPLYRTSGKEKIHLNSDPELLFRAMLQHEGIFCGTTDYLYELNGGIRRMVSVSSGRFYPEQYRVTGFDENILREICTYLYDEYTSEQDCIVFSTLGKKQYFLTSEHADLYEKFLASGTAEELEWSRK